MSWSVVITLNPVETDGEIARCPCCGLPAKIEDAVTFASCSDDNCLVGPTMDDHAQAILAWNRMCHGLSGPAGS